MSVLRSTTFQLHVKNEDGTTKMRSFTRAVTDAKETTENLNRTLGDNVEVTYKTTQSSKELTQQARMQVTQTERSNKAYRAMTEQLRHQITLVGKSESEQSALNAVMRLGAGATEQQKKEVYDLAMSYHTLTQSQNGTQGSMRNLRGVAQNFGWQLQDTVVQLQMGTDAMVVLSQQGSQMASAFGPAGAIFGAVIALSGALIGSLAPSLMSTGDEVEKLEEKMEGLNDIFEISHGQIRTLTEDYTELRKADSLLAELKLASALVELSDTVELVRGSLTTTFNDLADNTFWDNFFGLDNLKQQLKTVGQIQAGQKVTAEFERLAEQFSLTTIEAESLLGAKREFEKSGDIQPLLDQTTKLYQKYGIANEALTNYALTVVEADRRLKLINQTLTKGAEVLDDNTSGVTDNTEALEESAKTIDDLIESYTMKTIALAQTERQQALYTSMLDLSSLATNEERDAVVKAINTYYDRKNAIEASKESEKERIKLAKEAEKQAEREAKAIEKNRIAQVKQLGQLESMRVKQREALLKPIESGISSFIDNDALEAESRRFQENTDILNTQLLATKEWEYSERARINTLIEQEQERHKAAMTDISSQQLQSELNNALTFLQGMNQITSQLAGLAEEGTKEAELLFYANQAIAFANAIVNTEAAATRALAEGGMYAGIPMANIIRGIGYASAGIIAGTTLAGAFDKGGYIPSNQMGIVSEYGDELVNGVLVKGPARVTSREETAEMMNGGSGGVVQPVIHQNITVTGNGDKALIAAMEEAANKGAERGAKLAYSRVSKDFRTGRGIRAQLKQSTGM